MERAEDQESLRFPGHVHYFSVIGLYGGGLFVVINNNRGFFGGIIFQIFILLALVSAGAMVVRYFTNKTLVKELGRCHSKYGSKIKKCEKKKHHLERKVSQCKESKKKKAMGRENEVLKSGFSKCIAELKEEQRPWWKLWGEEEPVEVEKEIKKLPPPPPRARSKSGRCYKKYGKKVEKLNREIKKYSQKEKRCLADRR